MLDSKDFKETYEDDKKQFALSELIIALMEQDEVSVRELAKKAGLAPDTIQRLRAGKTGVNLSSFLSIVEACGGSVVVKMGAKDIALSRQNTKLVEN